MLKTLIGLSAILYGSLAGALDPPPNYQYPPYLVPSKLQNYESPSFQNFQKINIGGYSSSQTFQSPLLTAVNSNEEVQEQVIRRIGFHQSMNGHLLNNAEKEANTLIEGILLKANNGLKTKELFTLIMDHRDSENGLSLILNCAKALRHIKHIEGGDSSQRWFNHKNSTLFDLSLLKLSEDLIKEGKKLDRYGVYGGKRGWKHQLRQTRLHQREVMQYLSRVK